MVEDNEGDYVITSELLSMSELSIASLLKANRISEAIGLVNANKIDLILLDLSLPDSSGIETFKFMRRAAPDLPIIILSGQTDMKISLDAINLGAQDYLIKGEFDEKLLAKTILHSIERIRSHRELSESNERYNLISMATNDMVWD
jgi:DNA-binding response OmpR family regulator